LLLSTLERTSTSDHGPLALPHASPPPRHWLMKTEPDVFSYDDLVAEKCSGWDGVRNYQACNFLRAMRRGDLVIVYHSNHSNAAPPGVAGIARVAAEATPDPTQFDPPGFAARAALTASRRPGASSPPPAPYRMSSVDPSRDGCRPRGSGRGGRPLGGDLEAEPASTLVPHSRLLRPLVEHPL
jgi:hypothetical protein